MDFQQGLITTIHDYGQSGCGAEGLCAGLRRRPTSLLIPCLMEEFERPALGLIREVLRDLDGLQELVVALSAGSVEEVRAAETFFEDMPFPVRIHWTNGPAVKEVLQSLGRHNLQVSGPPGKGWAVWQGLGVASRGAEVIGLFDADIRTFSPAYPQRMLAPLMDPSHGVAYVKAFYSRLALESRALQGRATRLFVAPLLASLEQMFGSSNYLRYLRAFRYPLAGEFAFTTDLAMNLRIPSDWGLEVGLLSEVYRHVALSRIAQVDLGLFDHKHKELGSSPGEGLQRMCGEILATVLRGLMEHEGVALAEAHVPVLEVLYRRVGEDRVRQHGLDSLVNGLPYNRHGEELAVHEFANLVRPGVRKLLETPVSEQLPCWSRLISCEGGLRDDLAQAGSLRRSSLTAVPPRAPSRARAAAACSFPQSAATPLTAAV